MHYPMLATAYPHSMRADGNAYRDSYCNSHSNDSASDADGHSYGNDSASNADGDGNSFSHAEAYTDAETATDAAASSVVCRTNWNP